MTQRGFSRAFFHARARGHTGALLLPRLPTRRLEAPQVDLQEEIEHMAAHRTGWWWRRRRRSFLAHMRRAWLPLEEKSFSRALTRWCYVYSYLYVPAAPYHGRSIESAGPLDDDM